ncbi:MAG: methyltransferase domain-containing protein [Planctomycetota bacterium]
MTPSAPTPPTESPYVREPGYAERYRDRRFHTGSGPRTHARETAAIAALLRRAEVGDGAWLDVPSGAGRLSDACPQPVVQVDRDVSMLRACPAAAGRRRVCASALRLPFGDGTFAGVLCVRLLQHIAPAGERVALLRELARVSRGPVLLSYFDAASLQHWRRQARRALGKTRSGRCAVRWSRLVAELKVAGLRPIVRRPLRRWISEQTLVLAVPAHHRAAPLGSTRPV